MRPLSYLWNGLLAIAVAWILAACASSAPAPAASTQPPVADELVFFDWEDDMPQSVLDAFAKEYGIRVSYETYESSEEAVRAIQEGKAVDVLVMEARLLPLLIDDGLLAKLDFKNIPNFKNVSANFRDLAYDPKNAHSVPFNWGTTGIVVRSDLVTPPVTRWSDLWDPRFAGKVGIWKGQQRDLISMTLKSLGYSANSEDPVELEATLTRLLELKERSVYLEDYDAVTSATPLAEGKVLVAMGYATDVLRGRKLNPNIGYVLPAEGATVWGDNFAIPAKSANKQAAERFLNFILRPEISAQIVNANFYPMANDAAGRFIAKEIWTDPVVYPTVESLMRAEIILPLSPAGQKLHDAIWERFLAADR